MASSVDRIDQIMNYVCCWKLKKKLQVDQLDVVVAILQEDFVEFGGDAVHWGFVMHKVHKFRFFSVEENRSISCRTGGVDVLKVHRSRLRFLFGLRK